MEPGLHVKADRKGYIHIVDMYADNNHDTISIFYLRDEHTLETNATVLIKMKPTGGTGLSDLAYTLEKFAAWLHEHEEERAKCRCTKPDIKHDSPGLCRVCYKPTGVEL